MCDADVTAFCCLSSILVVWLRYLALAADVDG